MSFNSQSFIRWSPVYQEYPTISFPVSQEITVPFQWVYQAGNDTISDVQNSGYFVYFADWKNTLIYDNGNFVQIGDKIICYCQDGTTTLVVTSISSTIITTILAPIPPGSITTSDIANQAVTAPKIANNTITAAQIADNTITNAQISNSAGIVVGQGGTGVSSSHAYGVLCGGVSSNSPLQFLSGLGTAGQILTSNGNSVLPSFQTFLVGDLILVASHTNSNSFSSSINFDNMITSSYDNYLIVFELARSNATNANIQMQVGTGSTPTYQATEYANVSFGVFANGSGTTIQNTNVTTAFDLSAGNIVKINNVGTRGLSGTILITNCNSASNYKNMISDSAGSMNIVADSAEYEARLCTGGSWEDTTPITSLRFIAPLFTIAGKFYMYGLNK